MLATLLDRGEGAPLPLPPGLVERYGGPLRFPRGDRAYVFANFVSTIDGVVSYALPGRSQAGLVSAGHPADRFVLALLRAAADAVVVGAGTLRIEPDSVWTPEHVFAEAAGDFATLRAAMRKPERPLTVIVSASGKVDLSAPAFAAGDAVVILTSDEGRRLLESAPAHVRVRVLRSGTAAEMRDTAAAESGGHLILTEGGPTLFGQFLRETVVDELFLTIASRLAGRSDEERRLALVERAAFTPERSPAARLLSLKSADDYLFTRYALR